MNRDRTESAKDSLLTAGWEVEFEYDHFVRGKGQDQVFNDILDWLQNEKAAIKTTVRPIAIHVVHGSNSAKGRGYIADVRKNMRF